MFSLLEKAEHYSRPARTLAVSSFGMWKITSFSVLRIPDRELFMLSRFLQTAKRWPLVEKVTSLVSSSGTSRIVGLSNGMTPSLDTYTRWLLTQTARGSLCQIMLLRHRFSTTLPESNSFHSKTRILLFCLSMEPFY